MTTRSLFPRSDWSFHVWPVMRPVSLLLMGLLTMPALSAAETVDVVVWGATPAGITAAVGAAREGVRVALVEPADFVGGVMSGGLSFSDSNQTDRRVMRGLFEEVHLRIERHYQQLGVSLPYRVAEKDHTPWTYEPHVAEMIFNELLEEAGVRVFLEQELETVERRDGGIAAVVTPGQRFEAQVFIDASYEGDLMAHAGVSWTIGREGRQQYGERYAGQQTPKPPVLGVNPRDEQGNLLPLMTAEAVGDETAGDDRVMVYSFRLCLTKDPDNSVPLTQPPNYDPATYELVRRFVTAHPPQRLLVDLYPLPGGKFDGNNSIGGQISIGLVGGSNQWCAASYAERRQLQRAHRDYTQGLLWFMATDPAMPAALREEMRSYGYARDEFERHGHFSPALYVREGRRMLGRYVLTERDILHEVSKDDSIGVGSFPIDSHDVQRVVDASGDGFLNEGTIFPVRLEGRRHGQPHQLPYRAITPHEHECRNLLVPVALSSSHVAFSSVRVEPTWMVLGHSAGVAAALASQRNETVQALPYPLLRERLLAQGQALDPLPLPELPPPVVGIEPATLPGIVLDDQTAEREGAWQHSMNFKPYVGIGYRHDEDSAKGQMQLVFRPEIPEPGRYRIGLAYSPHPTRAANVPVTISVGDQQTVFHVDQRLPLDAGSPFRVIGEIDLPAGQPTTITLSNAGTSGFVICDAVQLLKVAAEGD